MKKKSIHSCIILCGGMSKRMGEDKGSMLINNTPMLIHVLESLNYQIDEAFIVLNNTERIYKYKLLINEYIKKNDINFSFNLSFLEDEIKNKGPMSGIITGLKNISGDYGLILPCDSPFVSSEYIETMFNVLDRLKSDYINFDGIIPFHFKKSNENFTFPKSGFYEREKTKDIFIENSEPLHSIYSKDTYKKMEIFLKKNQMKVKSIIKNIKPFFILIDEEYNNNTNTNNTNTNSKNNSKNKNLEDYKISKFNFRNINYKKDIEKIKK